ACRAGRRLSRGGGHQGGGVLLPRATAAGVDHLAGVEPGYQAVGYDPQCRAGPRGSVVKVSRLPLRSRRGRTGDRGSSARLKRGMNAKIAIRVLSTLIGIGLVLGGMIVAAALRPERGAKLILMALPLLALPLAFWGATLAGVRFWNWDALSRRERAFAFAGGILVMIFMAFLILLG